MLLVEYIPFNLFAGAYGTKRKPWFLFEKAFWVEKKGNLKVIIQMLSCVCCTCC